ncbi:hypothetical protein D3C85_704940 [compost metagenome]
MSSRADAREVTSGRYPSLHKHEPVTNLASLRAADPALHAAVEDVIGACREDMLPADAQHAIVAAMAPAVQREVVSRIAGLESSVLMTFKQQIQLVDSVLRRIVNPDGTATGDSKELGVSLKDAMNMSLKVTQVLTRDLPKIYTLDRIQKQERAMQIFMERHMDRKQQEKYLAVLQGIEKELDEESVG